MLMVREFQCTLAVPADVLHVKNRASAQDARSVA
jgi:hypothetical protein